MPLSRLIAIALVLFSLTAFGQTKQNTITPQTPTPVASEPWRILPDDLTKASASNSVLQPNDLVASPSGNLLDSYCFKIRSYVMARDSKESDSTHLVHYSTCQPASKYRLKTAEIQAQPPSR
jgi:hypothetical protein